MKYNKLELLLNMTDYDVSYQPMKKYGLYIYLDTYFFLYEAGEITEERLMKFVDNVINYRVQVVNPNESYYTQRFFHNSCDFFQSEDFIVFDFIVVEKYHEEQIIPFLKESNSDLKHIFIAATIDGKVLTEEETKVKMLEDKRLQKISYLESIANWKPDPTSEPFRQVFQNMSISNFAETHFGKDCVDISRKYKELAKKHHPDVGGDELMFKAIARAKEYLQTKIN